MAVNEASNSKEILIKCADGFELSGTLFEPDSVKAEIITLKPGEYGLKEIGHMKFFRSTSKILWNFALDWLDSKNTA